MTNKQCLLVVVVVKLLLYQAYTSSAWATTTTKTSRGPFGWMDQRSMPLVILQGSSWSLQADIVSTLPDQDRASSNNIHISNTTQETITTSHGNPMLLDLSSPREWLEYWEDDGQSGAYTVLRCDYRYGQQQESTPQQGKDWEIWGKYFHLQRLRDSTHCLLNGTSWDETQLSAWTNESHNLIGTLLSQAEMELSRRGPKGNTSPFSDRIVTFMITLLWQPLTKNTMMIKGHICSSLSPVHPTNGTTAIPMRAVIALPATTGSHAWPGRTASYPQAKLSSWCRQRRPLEKAFKVLPGVGEVLLVQDSQNDNNNNNNKTFTTFTEILEGLTSNVFFVYRGGILRTAPHGVLKGYARALILEHAPDCGLVVDTSQPVLLSDHDQWTEVFVTSSIRILAPIQELLVPIYDESEKDGAPTIAEFQSIWSQPSSSSSNRSQELYWQRLLHTITTKVGNGEEPQ